jgi:putative transposase
MERLNGPFRDIFQWIVSPNVLIRWLKRHQQRRANGDGKTEPKKPGRPWIGQEKVDAILRIHDSGLTGLSRIAGEMAKCGLEVVESSVRRVLTQHGREPTNTNRRAGSTWAQFWTRHTHSTVGADFIQMPIGLLGKVVNAFVFIAIEHDTRRVHLLGITIHPIDAWVAQCIRNATMDGEPLANRKHWILDNDRKYGVRTAAVLGTKLIETAIHAPDMNAYIERFNRSIEEECLDHIVFLSEGHLREYVVGYLTHYNSQRPHQGIGNVPIGPWQIGSGEIVCAESMHGLLKSFHRAA